MAYKRGGLAEATNLPTEFRRVLEPMLDILKAITAQVGTQLKPLRGGVVKPLPAAAVLGDVINKVNELIDAHEETRAKVNEVIKRIQED